MFGDNIPFGSMNEFLRHQGIWSASIHAIVGLFLPLMMICVMTRFYGKNRSWKEGLQAAPFALFAGGAMVVPYWLLSFMGPEFPALGGAIVGLVIVMAAAQKGFLVPKNTWDFDEKEKWDPSWSDEIVEVDLDAPKHITLFKAWLSYGLIVILLVLTRLRNLPFGDMIKSWVVSVPNILGTEISYSVQPLNLPGIFPFLPIALLGILFLKVDGRRQKQVWKATWKQLWPAIIAMFGAFAMVQVMQGTNNNSMDYLGMLPAMATYTATALGPVYPMFAPWVGILGAFMTGSNMSSNLMFSEFQYTVADNLGISHLIVIALQCVGGAIGNMICPHNIIAAQTTVGLKNKEGIIIKRNLLPAIVYAISAGLIGILFIYVLFPGTF